MKIMCFANLVLIVMYCVPEKKIFYLSNFLYSKNLNLSQNSYDYPASFRMLLLVLDLMYYRRAVQGILLHVRCVKFAFPHHGNKSCIFQILFYLLFCAAESKNYHNMIDYCRYTAINNSKANKYSQFYKGSWLRQILFYRWNAA